MLGGMIRHASRAVLALVLLFASFAAAAQTNVPDSDPKVPVAGGTLTESPKSASAESPKGAAYSLSPDKLAKAIELSRIRGVLHFVGAAWDVLVLFAVLQFGIAAAVRRFAERCSGNSWVQGLVFLVGMMLILEIAALPLAIYRHILGVRYGLSVQGWGGWLLDDLKQLGLSIALFYGPVMLLRLILRKAPQKWWLIFWGMSIPAVVILVFVAPVLIDRSMDTLQPLEPHAPALVQRISQITKRGGLDIPPSRMFWQEASKKTTQMNAKVTGLGATKRVVVWDTTVAKMSMDETSFVFGHEMGHYVMDHIWKGIGFSIVVLFVSLALAKVCVDALVDRFAPDWGVRTLNDWPVLVVLMLVLSVFSFFLEPVNNAFSRYLEHEADVYGIEVVHGIVANPQEAARMSFQKLGEASLEDPNPNRFVQWWTGSHPTIPERAAWAAGYDPWQPGKSPKYFANSPQAAAEK